MQKRKKIVVLSCHGGGGHVSAAHAIKSYLQSDEYEIVTLDAIGKSLVRLDPFYVLSLGKYSGQDFYNFLLKHNQKRLTNIFFYIGIFMINLRQRALKNLLVKTIRHESADLVISVIPLINGLIANAAKACNVPCLMVPTDLDIDSFIRDLKPPYDATFKICLGLDYPEVRKPLEKIKIPAKNIEVTGFPIRPSFFEKKDTVALKQALSISLDKPIVLLVMGATGSTATLKYLNALSNVIVPFHIIACIGRNKELEKKVHETKLPHHITISVLNSDYTISDAMAMADICISKPGSVTFAETLYMNLPVLLDKTSATLLWEQFNIDFTQTNGLGNPITNLDEVETLITRYLTNKQFRNTVQENIRTLKKKHFGTEFIQLVKKTLSSDNKSIKEHSSVAQSQPAGKHEHLNQHQV